METTRNSKRKSLACNENIDITDTTQLAVSLHGIIVEFDRKVELLSLQGMHGFTIGEDLFEKVETSFECNRHHHYHLTSDALSKRSSSNQRG